MMAFIVALALLGIGTLGCSVGDTSVTGPGQTSGGSPSISEGVAGRVTNDSGGPIATAMVQPRSLDDNGPPIPEIAVYSDADGGFAWRLFPGRYELQVSAAGYQTAAAPATVGAGEVTTLNFTLQRLP
ncbi:MAG: PEGA domain-containing protein [Luteitalea sp.]|nr:PEGA domain-containing protein [Luteitalea sp.]